MPEGEDIVTCTSGLTGTLEGWSVLGVVAADAGSGRGVQDYTADRRLDYFNYFMLGFHYGSSDSSIYKPFTDSG